MSEPGLTPETLAAHDRFVRALARALVVDPSIADDLAQETWLAALGRAPRDEKSLRAWLAGITRNLASRARRGERRRTRREAEAARPVLVPSVEEIQDREAARRDLVAAVLALKEPYRATLLLRYFQELAPRAIARQLGVPVETVRTRIKRGLAMLRSQLDREHGEGRSASCLALIRTLQLDPGIRVRLLTPHLNPAILRGLARLTANKHAAGAAGISLCLLLLVIWMRSRGPNPNETLPPVVLMPETGDAAQLLSEACEAAGSPARIAAGIAESAPITSTNPFGSPSGDPPARWENAMKHMIPIPAAMALLSLAPAASASGVLAQQAYAKASNTGIGDSFGRWVAISGDTMVVGAPSEASNATGVNGNELDNSATGAGAAYVFVRNGATWTQQAYLKASNTGGSDSFGQAVAISGDTIVVGSVGEASNATGVNGNQGDNSASNSGAAYVFVRNGTTWTQQAYLKASNTESGDRFGASIAVSGDTVVVGADSEDSAATGVNGNQADNTASFAGAAYVFVRNGTTWTQEAYLKASTVEASDFFGQRVAVSGDTIVVIAGGEDSSSTGVNGNEADNSAGESGAAFVFVRSGTTWTQQAYVKASNPDPYS